MEHTISFYPLLVVTGLAVLVPVLLKPFARLGIPIVVGEIVAGMVAGPSGLGLIAERTPNLDFLKLFGFVYLMFLSGLEVDFGLLFGRRRPGTSNGWRSLLLGSALRAGVTAFVVTLLISAGASILVLRLGLARDPVIIALILSTTSLGVVMPVLKERGLIKTELGQHILVYAVIGDFATVLLVSAYLLFFSHGLSFQILLVLALLAATFLVYRLAEMSQRRMPLSKLIEELSGATSSLDIRGALALAVMFIALAQGLGVEVILGAFLAGAILSLLSEEQGSNLRPKLNALGFGFFVPVFFIMVGADFRISMLFANRTALMAAPLLLLLALLVKFGTGLVYRPLFDWTRTIAFGSLISARLSLIIAIAAVGVGVGAISRATEAAAILVAVATVVIAPLLFNGLIPPPPEERPRVVVVGAPSHARLLAQRLVEHGEDVVVVTANPNYPAKAKQLGINTVYTDPDGYTEAARGVCSTGRCTLVCMLDDEKKTAVLAAAAHSWGLQAVVAYVEDHALASSLRRNGIQVIEPSRSLLAMLEATIRFPQVVSLLTEENGDREVETLELRSRELDGVRLRDIRMPGDALILVITRDGHLVIPRGRTELAAGDLLTLVGSKESVERAKLFFSVTMEGSDVQV
jgi:trk system potassium uptake protein TrkA